MHCPHTHLNARLGQVDFHGDLFARINVRIVRLLEGTLQLLQLRRCEGGANATLLALLGQDRIVAGVDFVGQAGCEGQDEISYKNLSEFRIKRCKTKTMLITSSPNA